MLKKLPKNVFVFTGLWITPITIAGCFVYFYIFNGHIEFRQILESIGLGIALAALLLVKNLYDMLRYGKKEFKFSNMIMTPEYKQILQKQKAMYPPVPGKYLVQEPEGFLLGQDKHKKYVRLDSSKAINNLIIGPPGSGKSVTLLSTLINNFKGANPPFQVVAVDVKGELNEKSVRKGHDKVKIVNPTVKNSVGWDPYYNISKSSSQEEVEEEIQLIVNCIVRADNPRNQFFIDNARDLLTGLLSYYYEVEGLDFCSSIEKINTSSTNEIIEKIKPTLDANSRLIAARYLGKFYGKKTNSMSDVDSTMRQTLVLFSKPAVIYSFRDNKEKASPKSIDEGFSIFIDIPQNKLEMYGPYFRLLVSQMLSHMQERSESAKPVLFLLDELPTMGRIDQLTQALSTLRSRNVSIWCIIQSMSQLKSIYGPDDATVIKDDCQVKTVLNCDSLETAKEITEMLGTFYIKKQSVSGGALFGNNNTGTTNESVDRQQIVDPSDLTTLKNMNEVVLVLDGTYARVNKLLYYADKNFKTKAAEILKYNEVCRANDEKDNPPRPVIKKELNIPVPPAPEKVKEEPQKENKVSTPVPQVSELKVKTAKKQNKVYKDKAGKLINDPAIKHEREALAKAITAQNLDKFVQVRENEIRSKADKAPAQKPQPTPVGNILKKRSDRPKSLTPMEMKMLRGVI